MYKSSFFHFPSPAIGRTDLLLPSDLFSLTSYRHYFSQDVPTDGWFEGILHDQVYLESEFTAQAILKPYKGKEGWITGSWKQFIKVLKEVEELRRQEENTPRCLGVACAHPGFEGFYF